MPFSDPEKIIKPHKKAGRECLHRRGRSGIILPEDRLIPARPNGQYARVDPGLLLDKLDDFHELWRQFVNRFRLADVAHPAR